MARHFICTSICLYTFCYYMLVHRRPFTLYLVPSSEALEGAFSKTRLEVDLLALHVHC